MKLKSNNPLGKSFQKGNKFPNNAINNWITNTKRHFLTILNSIQLLSTFSADFCDFL